MYLFAGLGNKGKVYNYTRHNVGFLVIDKILKFYNFSKDRESSDSLIYRGFIFKKKTILVKPMDFVNNSGKAIVLDLVVKNWLSSIEHINHMACVSNHFVYLLIIIVRCQGIF